MYGNILTEVTSNSAFQPFLPFLFVIAVIYGLLSLVDVFKKKSVNFIISLVFALFAAGYQPFVNFFFLNFGNVLWSFVILFFVAFIFKALGLTGKRKIPPGKENVPMVIATIIIIFLAAFGFAYIKELKIPVIGTENFLVVLGLVLLVIIFYYAYEYGNSVARYHEALKRQRGG